MHRRLAPLAARIGLFAIALALVLPACKRGGGSSVVAGMQLLSPSSPTATIFVQTLSIEVSAGDLTGIKATNAATGADLTGVKSGTSFFVHDVELSPGTNQVTLTGTRPDGSTRQLVLNLQRSPGPGYAVNFTASPELAESTPATVTFALQWTLPAPPTQVLLDPTRDGTFDLVQAIGAALTATYANAGTFKPRLLVRTADNQLISMPGEHSPTIRIVPATAPDPALAIAGAGNGILDLDLDPTTGNLFVLASGDGVVRVFDRDRSPVRTIALPGVQTAAGIGLDTAANLYVADRAGNQVLKLLAPNYQPDPLVGAGGRFGAAGNGPGQFAAPEDVATEGSGNDLRIYVADTGNNRVQRFNRAGVHESTFDGTAGGGAALATPRSMVALPGGGIAVLEPDAVRILSSIGETVGRFGAFQDAVRLTRNLHDGGLVVADPAANRARLMGLGGWLRRGVAVAAGPDAALVLPSPTGGLLVLADRTSADLAVAPLLQDPPGETPVAVTTAFLAAIAAGTLPAARNLVAGPSLADFDALVGDPAVLARIRAQAPAVTDLTLIEQSAQDAFVQGQRDEAGTPVPVDFVLVRADQDGRWRLRNF